VNTALERRRILIVDDEVMVRGIVQRMLEEDGYHVYEAGDGLAALDFVRTAPDLLDLVVTDIAMSRLNGIVLMQVLAVESAELPCVLISGYAPPGPERFGMAPPCGVMQKPLEATEFLAEVRRSLRNRN
jgi:CheY-like chemotaxis protein